MQLIDSKFSVEYWHNRLFESGRFSKEVLTQVLIDFEDSYDSGNVFVKNDIPKESKNSLANYLISKIISGTNLGRFSFEEAVKVATFLELEDLACNVSLLGNQGFFPAVKRLSGKISILYPTLPSETLADLSIQISINDYLRSNPESYLSVRVPSRVYELERRSPLTASLISRFSYLSESPEPLSRSEVISASEFSISRDHAIVLSNNP